VQVFELSRSQSQLRPLALPADLQVQEALSRVLRLPAVASKRYLTNKVGHMTISGNGIHIIVSNSIKKGLVDLKF
jgi:hypothetical protein